MVCLAASVVTKAGKPLISRQFHASLSRSRIESLLLSFVKLIPPGVQHTTLLSADKTVRFVYMPVDELYVLLLTPPLSNILLDIETLHLIGRIVSETCSVASGRGGATEAEVLRNSFELLSSFDEVVSLGYRERVGISEVRAAMEMESHEERIQEIIARNKEQEAKEELKRRAKQLEMQRREMLKRGQSPYTSGSGASMGMSGYERASTYTPAAPVVQHISHDSFGASPAPKPIKGKGMQLGAKKKQTDLMDALGGEVASLSDARTPLLADPEPEPIAAPSPAPIAAKDESPFPPVEAKDVHLVLREKLQAELNRDGGLNSLELKGDLDLRIGAAAAAKVVVQLAGNVNEGVQFKTHPNVDKAGWTKDRRIGLKDPKRGFPVGQGLGVLKYRLTSKDESLVPLSINCWPSPTDNGTCDVNIEYELESNATVPLHNVVISIPLPPGHYPEIANADGSYSINPETHTLEWVIEVAEPGQDSASGSMEFNVAGDDTSAFFPIAVDFVAQHSLCGIDVASVRSAESGEDVDYSLDRLAVCEDYAIV